MAPATRSALLSGALGILLGGGVVWLNGGGGKTRPPESPATGQSSPRGGGADRVAATAIFGKTSPPPTASFEKGRSYVAERLGKGVWTEADRERMRDMLGDMSDQERTELIKQVIVAVNKGLVKVELEGPVF